MQQQRAGFELEQQVLCTPPGLAHALSGDFCGKTVRNAPAESRLVHRQRDDLAADDVRVDATSRRLDFRKLRHGERLQPGRRSVNQQRGTRGHRASARGVPEASLRSEAVRAKTNL
jgi:hypothetical protein